MFVFGMALAIGLIIYSVNWDDLPVQFTLVGGRVITVYVMASILVMTGIMATTLIKSGIYGKWKLD